jgi:mycothiol synthase
LDIEPFEKDDYATVVEIRNRAIPRDPTSVHRMRDWDENHPPHVKLSRYVTRENGRISGVGEYSQSPEMYHPQKFGISVYVKPDRQNQGIGSALFEHVTRALEPFEPVGYQARTYEDEKKNNRFLLKRGFREDFRMWESRLDVETFDWSRWESFEKRLEDEGIEVRTLADLKDDPNRDRRLFELEVETTADIPSPASVTSRPDKLSASEKEALFGRYELRVFNNPDRPGDAYFVAVKDGEYIGLAYNTVDLENQTIEVEMTGVRREHRGQGIATALKLKGVAYAQKNGFRTMVTGNDTLNLSILAINEKMGFVREPELIFYVKDL